MLHGCTGAGGRIRSGRQPASLLGLGIQRLLRFALLRASSPATSRVPAAEREPAQRALDRRLRSRCVSISSTVVVKGPGDGPRPRRRPARGGQAWPPRSWPRRATGATRCSRGDPRPAEIVDGRSRSVNSGGPEQLVVGREGQERPFSPDVWGLDVRRLQRPAPRRLPRRGSPATGGFNVEPREAAPLDGAHDARHGPCAGSVRSRLFMRSPA